MKQLSFLILSLCLAVITAQAQQLSLDESDTVVTVCTITSMQNAKIDTDSTTQATQSPKLYHYKWGQLGPKTKEKICNLAKIAPFGAVLPRPAGTVKSITKIDGMPSRSKKTITQYVVVYDDGSIILTYDNPTWDNEAIETSPGYHQGDDEAIPHKEAFGENHKISNVW